MEVADGMEVETGFSNPPSSDLPSDIVGFLRENDLRQLTLADVKREIRKRYYASPPGDAEIEGALDTALARMAAESPLVITAVRAALRRARAETAARKLPVSAPAAPPDAVAEYDEGSTQEQGRQAGGVSDGAARGGYFTRRAQQHRPAMTEAL